MSDMLVFDGRNRYLTAEIEWRSFVELNRETKKY